MNIQFKNHVRLLAVVAVVALTLNAAFADDLNPPPYRGGPLSVYAHWNLIPGTTILDLNNNWSSVDDSDPTTVLYPNFTPNIQVIPSNGAYDFQIPNWVDNLPIKYLRLQLTWENNLLPPLNIFSQGLEGVNPVIGQIVYTSPLQTDAAAIKAYQYYDLIYKTNPDFERSHIDMPANALLTQVVVDSISTVPEPTTLLLLSLGGLGLLRRSRM